MKVRHITTLDYKAIAGVTILYHMLTKQDPHVYAQYIYDNWECIALFILEAPETIGFVEANTPSILYPKEGYINHTFISPGVPKKYSKRLHRAVIDWYRSIGVSKIQMATERKPEAFTRAWGYKPADKVLMELNIED